MSDIQFEESSMARQVSYQPVESKSAMAKFLIKIGAAKTEAQANVILVIMSLLMLAITAYIFIKYIF